MVLRNARPWALALAGVALAASSGWALSTKRLMTPIGEGSNPQFGWSTASAGDMNGDGFDDVIVGSYLFGGGTSKGRAYVYLGGPSPDNVADLVLDGEGIGDSFGFSVAGAGDVNGDGFSDVIVGAMGNDAGGSSSGRVYIYFGGATLNAVADLTMTGSAAESLGRCVAGAGDVNGDGFGDWIINGASSGRVYVFYGGASPNTVADLTYDPAGMGQLFGQTVAGAGDVNGDGFDDLLVSAPFADFGSTDAGVTYLYFGGPFAGVNPNRSFIGDTGSLSGTTLAAGDLNNDGYSDIIVGGPAFNGGSSLGVGRVYVYLGGPLGDNTVDMTLNGRGISDEYGGSLCVLGDVNRDGFDDLAVGSQEGITGSTFGRVDIYLGASSLSSSSDLALAGELPQDHFGVSICGAGDVNGDGFGDLVSGANSHAVVGTQTGAAYVIAIYPYELLTPNGGETWVVGEHATVSWLGMEPADVELSNNGGAAWSTLAAGVGGDFSNSIDVVVPSPATDVARVRVTLSGSTPRRSNSDESVAAFRIVEAVAPTEAAIRKQLEFLGEAGNDAFGTPGSAGDMNGDGFGDFVIGARGNDIGTGNSGRAYLYFGGPALDATADLVVNGTSGEFLGAAVANAGDVNHDGYSDVIVGATFNDAGGTDAGRAYVYFGGPTPDATADWTLTGEATLDGFGKPVASAGDVNGDGYDDVIVGTPGNDAGGSGAGRAYVYFGGVAPNTTADMVVTGLAAGDDLGFAVCGGDLNGDGFSDVVVGAHLNDVGGSNAGAFYVFFGGAAPNATVDATFLGKTNDQIAFALATADVNGDGFADLIAGGTQSGSTLGIVEVFLGGTVFDVLPDLVLRGELTGDNLGAFVAAVGDVNADGFDDIAIGASGNDAGGSGAGRVYVHFGSTLPDAAPDAILTGEAASDSFAQIASAGDVNGDGFDDVLVGAEGNDIVGANAGKAYLYDWNRFHLLAPQGGETWDVGGTQTVSWLGGEPADVRLSVDGGATYELLETNAGGGASNSVAVRVPHLPSRFARVEIVPTANELVGSDRSDSLFTVQADVTLFFLRTARADGGVELSWDTEPKVAPDGLAGYRLYRLNPGEEGNGTRIGPSLLAEAAFTDASGRPGHTYRLTAVNGLGAETEVGRVAFQAPFVGLKVWPLPARAGTPLHTAFFAPLGTLGVPASDLDVAVYDVAGRRVATLAHGQVASQAGLVQVDWDLHDTHGSVVGQGVYFVRAVAPSVGFAAKEKVIVR